AAGLAGRDQPRSARERGALGFQLRDHLIYVLARLTDLGVELLAEPTLVCFLALTERVFALLHPSPGLAQRLALLRHETLLVLERAHVAIDLREMLRELRLARAHVLARGADHRRIQAEARRDLDRQAASRRSVAQLTGR